MTSEVRRAASAAVWLAAGQAAGFAWALLLMRTLGTSSYGQFATAVAAAALVTIPLDAWFLVRAPRVTDPEFRAERALRTALGLALLGAGAAALPFALVAGLALAKGGATVVFNALRSGALRDGHPQVAVRSDTVRALLCLAAGSLALLLVATPSIGSAAGSWLLGYVPFVLLALPLLRDLRPRLPRRGERATVIVGDALGGAAYLQGDIVLVNALLGHAAGGRYAFGALVVGAVGAVGMNFGATFHERLRAAGGDPSAGPPVRHALAGAGLAAVGVAVAALVAGLLADDRLLAVTLLVFALVAATRFTGGLLTTLLVAGGHDHARLRVTLTALPVKVVAVVLLAAVAGLGAPGAVLGYLLGDAVMVLGALRVVRAARAARSAHGGVPT